jgi:hypothetical protein
LRHFDFNAWLSQVDSMNISLEQLGQSFSADVLRGLEAVAATAVVAARPPLPYGGDLEAAVRARDHAAIRQLMPLRDKAHAEQTAADFGASSNEAQSIEARVSSSDCGSVEPTRKIKGLVRRREGAPSGVEYKVRWEGRDKSHDAWLAESEVPEAFKRRFQAQWDERERKRQRLEQGMRGE